MERKRLFRMALASAEMTQTEWAKANDVTASYLSNLLAGHVESDAMWERIEAFTTEELRRAGVAP